jgi:hypothetical protein
VAYQLVTIRSEGGERGLPVSRNGRQPSRAGNRGLDIGATPYFSAAVLIAAPTLWDCQSDCALL